MLHRHCTGGLNIIAAAAGITMEQFLIHEMRIPKYLKISLKSAAWMRPLESARKLKNCLDSR